MADGSINNIAAGGEERPLPHQQATGAAAQGVENEHASRSDMQPEYFHYCSVSLIVWHHAAHDAVRGERSTPRRMTAQR